MKVVELLDLIYSVDFSSQTELADMMSVSVSSIERKIRHLKSAGLIWITRDIDKNMYYLLGTDAEKKWTAKECIDILKHRDIGYKDKACYPRTTSTKTINQSKELDDIVNNLEETLINYSKSQQSLMS
jgi:biotin operon repressor